MFELFTLELKDWGGLVASVVALSLSVWSIEQQRRAGKLQLQERLFDKRYNVFLAVEEFVTYVLQVDGLIDLPSQAFRNFEYSLEKASFLFGPEVRSYMEQVKYSAIALRSDCIDRARLERAGERDPDVGRRITEKLGDLSDPVLKKRVNVFGPYLKAGSSDVTRTRMQLHYSKGWRRLFAVVAVLWLVFVSTLKYDL